MGLGLFGKLPAKGDFITRAIPPEVLSFWEGWLEKVMGGAKHHLAGEWGQVYEMSPVWRFWIGPGVYGQAMAGALGASVDKVGRQFPLTLVLSGEGAGHPVPPLSDPMEDWYGMLERALLSAKSTHFDGDVDGFLAALPAPSAAPCALGEDRRNAFFAYGEHGLGQMLADVRDHDHQLAAFQRSYWWTGGNEHVGPGMIAMDGMPDAMGFAGMLRGFGPPARVQQPAPAVAGVAAGAASGATGTARETTVPPRDLIGDAEEAEAAAAWGAEAAREELAWAAPTDAVDDAWTEAITGDEAESPFDKPEAEWDFPDAGAAVPEPEQEATPTAAEALPEAEEDLFDAGPEPYGVGGAEVGEDIYADLSAGGEESAGDGEASDADVADRPDGNEETEAVPVMPSMRSRAGKEAGREDGEDGDGGVMEAEGADDAPPDDEAGDDTRGAAEADDADRRASGDDLSPDEAADAAVDTLDAGAETGDQPASEAGAGGPAPSDGETQGEDEATRDESSDAESDDRDAPDEAAAMPDPDEETAAEETAAEETDGAEDVDAGQEAEAEQGAEAELALKAEDALAEPVGAQDTLDPEVLAETDPGDEDSPFGDGEMDEAGLGRRKPGLRGLFGLRNRGKD